MSDLPSLFQPPAADPEAERHVREAARERLRHLLNGSRSSPEEEMADGAARRVIREEIAAYNRAAVMANRPRLPESEDFEQWLVDGLLHYGLLSPLLRDGLTEEIFCDGPDRVSVVRGGRHVLTALSFESEAQLLATIKKLAADAGRRVDEASPLVEGRLPGGARLHAVIPPVARPWPYLTIRKFPDRLLRLADLCRDESFLTQAAGIRLVGAIRAGANVLIVGGTGSGKCVVGDTRITTGDGGLTPIRDLVEGAFRTGPVSRGADGWTSAPLSSSVLSCDFASGCIRPVNGATAWRHPAPADLVSIRTRTGKVVRVTPEHPFFTVASGRVTQIRADQLRQGDRIAVARSISSSGVLPDVWQQLRNSRTLYATGVTGAVDEAMERIRARCGFVFNREIYDTIGLKRQRVRFWRKKNAIPLPRLLSLLDEADLSWEILGPAIRLKSKTGAADRAIPCPRYPSEELARLAGMVAGDGHLGKSAVELTSGDPDVRASFVALAHRLFGLEVHTRSASGRCPTLRIHSRAVRDLLLNVYAIPDGRKAASVGAPGWLFAAPSSHIAAYLSGLLDTDGSVSQTPDGAAGSVDFWTCSRRLAEDIVALLLRLGVRSHLGARARNFRISIYERDALARLRDLLALAHPQRGANLATDRVATTYSAIDLIPGLAAPIRELRLAAGLSRAELARVLDVSRRLVGMYESGTRLPPRARVIDFVSRLEMSEPTRRLSALASLPVFWDRVDAVERQSDHGEQFVYDLTVPGTNTFLLGEGGIVGHNTTLLNALLAELPGRTVIIEETAELQIQEIPFAVALEGRPPNVEGAGEIALRPLVKTGLRMRPRRIVIGESRGPEALDLLQAMNTGHPGSLTTAHANGPRDGLERLVTMAAEAGERLPESTLRRMVAQAISLVVYLEADAHGQRAVQEIWELTGMEGDRFLGHALFERRDGRLHRSNLPSRWTAEPRRNGLAREAPHAGW